MKATLVSDYYDDVIVRMCDMKPGQLGIVCDPRSDYIDHVCLCIGRPTYDFIVLDLDTSVQIQHGDYWDKSCTLKVRLLRPDESVVLKNEV